MTTQTRTSHEAETLAPVVPQRVVDAASALLERAVDAKLTIAAAESCTGGLLSALLTDVEGASHAFERGFVVYTDAAKCELLGIARNLVADCGAVSREVAVAMAEGALAQSGADIAVSVTGFAGPGGPGDEPGLVHFGCIRSGRDVVHREEHFGDIGRGPTRIACLETAIAMLNDALGAG